LAIWEDTMMENASLVGSGDSASLLLGRKLDSIPFSIYHVQIILVLGVVGFVEGYDVALGGSLLVLAKEPLHLTPEQIRWLAVAPILFLVLGAFTAGSISDRLSRKTVMQIGVISSTFLTLLIPLTQTGTQLLVIRLLTGFGAGFAVAAPFPIAAELMPAQHRRTYGAIYEVMLASAFTLLPFVGFVLAGNPEGFRLIALPGGLALGVVPLLVHFGLPESPRWHLSRGNTKAAVEAVNRMIARSGGRIQPLTIAALLAQRIAGLSHAILQRTFIEWHAMQSDADDAFRLLYVCDGASAVGTFETCRRALRMSADRGIPEVIATRSERRE
jgi:putative MFS transporter